MESRDYDARDEIVLCEGEISCKGYKGPIVVCVEKEFYCPDIHVYHEYCCKANVNAVLNKGDEYEGGVLTDKLFLCKEMPYENESFQAAVISMMQGWDLIPAEGDWSLCSAELGMQGYDISAFEWLGRNNEKVDWGKKVAVKAGAIDLDAEDKKEREEAKKSERKQVEDWLDKYNELNVCLSPVERSSITSYFNEVVVHDKEFIELKVRHYLKEYKSYDQIIDMLMHGDFNVNDYFSENIIDNIDFDDIMDFLDWKLKGDLK